MSWPLLLWCSFLYFVVCFALILFRLCVLFNFDSFFHFILQKKPVPFTPSRNSIESTVERLQERPLPTQEYANELMSMFLRYNEATDEKMNILVSRQKSIKEAVATLVQNSVNLAVVQEQVTALMTKQDTIEALLHYLLVQVTSLQQASEPIILPHEQPGGEEKEALRDSKRVGKMPQETCDLVGLNEPASLDDSNRSIYSSPPQLEFSETSNTEFEGTIFEHEVLPAKLASLYHGIRKDDGNRIMFSLDDF